jgi:fucose permease
MAEDLHITASMSSLLGSLFFLGYFFFQIPGALYAANRSAKTYILVAHPLGRTGDGDGDDQ